MLYASSKLIDLSVHSSKLMLQDLTGKKESKNMAAYYSNALCCIAAAGAKDSSEGILTERRVARYGLNTWQSPAGLVLLSPHTDRRQFRTLLLSRGWCLQEWLLSPRILHWTSNGLIWQCAHGFFWEGQSGFRGEPPVVFHDTYRATRQANDCILDLGFCGRDAEGICKILSCNDKDAVGEAWTHLVSQFVQMDLSFTDRLAAIRGEATRLSERHGIEYFAGVFWSQCIAHLLWMTRCPQNSVESGNSFPTWSWASSQGGIYFSWDSRLELSLVSDLHPFPSAEEQSNLLYVANKELRFTAPLVKLSDLVLAGADSASEEEDTESKRKGGLTEGAKSSDICPELSGYVFGS